MAIRLLCHINNKFDEFNFFSYLKGMSGITKNALRVSLLELLQEKPFSKIRVSDITSRCGVSRMTFYYHFYDIYALLKWILEEGAKKLLEGKHNYANWQEWYRKIFTVIENNKKAILNIYRYAPREYLENTLRQLTYFLVKDVVEEKSEGMNIKKEDKEFISNFYKFGLVGIVLDWIDDEMKTPPEKIIKNLSNLLTGTLDLSLVRFQKNAKS